MASLLKHYARYIVLPFFTIAFFPQMGFLLTRSRLLYLQKSSSCKKIRVRLREKDPELQEKGLKFSPRKFSDWLGCCGLLIPAFLLFRAVIKFGRIYSFLSSSSSSVEKREGKMRWKKGKFSIMLVPKGSIDTRKTAGSRLEVACKQLSYLCDTIHARSERRK